MRRPHRGVVGGVGGVPGVSGDRVVPAGRSAHRAQHQHPFELAQRRRLVPRAVGEQPVGYLIAKGKAARPATVERLQERKGGKFLQRLGLTRGPLFGAKTHRMSLLFVLRRSSAVPMVKLQRRPFGEPDDVREIPYGHLETYDMGEIRIGRSVLQPGWRWSESIKPIARIELCGPTTSACASPAAHGSGCVRVPELLIEAGRLYQFRAATTPGSWVTSPGSRSTGSRVRRSRVRRVVASTDWWRRSW